MVLGIASRVAAQNPAAVEHQLRFAVRLAGQPDTALDLVDRMKSYHVPGLSLAIIDNYRVVYAKGFGVAEFGKTKPVDSTTLFLAGSISKPIFASGFLRVVEDKKLPLDADVNTMLKSWHLPESRFTATEKVTLRRLLSHSAGLTVWGFPGYDLSASIPTVPQLLDGAPPANTPAVRNDTTPGARWLYSGGGITIAQLVSTDVTGETFPRLMERTMLKPAGMSRSTYENPLPVARRAEAASGHEQLDTPVPGGFHAYPEMAAAGLWTTASDLGRWAIALSHSYRGERGGVLSTPMAKEMLTKQMRVLPPYGNGFWGLGVSVAGDGDSLSFSHGGRDEGFVANMVMWPARGRGLVIMMNGVNGGLMNEIQRAFAQEYGLGDLPRVERKLVSLSGDKLAEFAGSYVGVANNDTTRIDMNVTRDGKLMLTHSGLRRTGIVAPVSDDTFVSLESGSEWKFDRENGAIVSLSTGVGPNRRTFARQTQGGKRE